MGRRPCTALLLFMCSCSLDTTPDVSRASEEDAATSPLRKQQASVRFDAPVQPRKEAAVRRTQRDDADAGEANDDAKPESREAGRPASARPAMSPSRDAGVVDAGDKQKSTLPEGQLASGDVSDNGEPDGSQKAEPSDSGQHGPDSGDMTEPSSPSPMSGQRDAEADRGSPSEEPSEHGQRDRDEEQRRNGRGHGRDGGYEHTERGREDGHRRRH